MPVTSSEVAGNWQMNVRKREIYMEKDFSEIILRPLFEKLISYIDNNEKWKAILISLGLPILIYGLGIVTKYLYDLKKTNLEIAKLHTEIESARFTNLSMIESKKEKCNDTMKLLYTSLEEVGLFKDNDFKQASEIWRELTKIIHFQLIPDFRSYIEYSLVYCNNRPLADKERYIIEEIEMFSESLFFFNNSLNDDSILNIMKEKIFIDFSICLIYLDLSKSILPFYKFKKIKKIENLIKKIEALGI